MDEPRNHVELSKRARRDLKAIPKGQRERLALEIQARLSPIPLPQNADVETISGRAPWMRLRWGAWRVIYRPLSSAEAAQLVMQRGTLDGPTGYLVERIVDRKYLERAVRTLEFGKTA